MKKVKFYTLGCKTNQYETQAIREGLVSSGSYEEVAKPKAADICVINTCTVTSKADRDSRYIINYCHRENPNAKIIVTGCLVQLDEDTIKNLPGVSFTIGNSQKHRIPALMTGTLSITHGDTFPQYENNMLESVPATFIPLKISDFHDRTRAFIKIQDGCDNLCSYCKIPLVRGNSRSRGLDDILDEVGRLLDKNFKELVLTGICLGDWGRGLYDDIRLAHLIEKIDTIEKGFRLRLSSIEPNMISDELITAISRSKKVCRHLHIPLQNGSDRILKLMNRPYTAKGYMKIIKRIRRAIKNISITTDVMVGFPTESDRDFKETIRLIRSIRFLRTHIFRYSKREMTRAAAYEEVVPDSIIEKRRSIISGIAETTSYNYRRRFINKDVQGLIETRRDPSTNLLTGYTDTYIRFLLDGPDSLMGRILTLKISKVGLKSTYCKYLFY